MTAMDPETTKEEIDIGPKWANIPEDLESAIERIKRLEWVLSDLSRSVEIAIAMDRPELMNEFIVTANKELETKIDQIHNDDQQPIKIVRVVDDVSDKEEKDAKV
jgi:hypothetical protein